MKFLSTKGNLEYAVTLAERFTGKNLTLTVLSALLFEVKGDMMTVTATNLESAIQIHIHGKGSGDGRVSVPAKVISSLIQSIHDDKILLEEKQGNVIIQAERKNTKIHGVSSEDFPPLPHIKKISSFSVEGDVFADGLHSVLPAVSLSEFKPELQGVACIIQGNMLRLAATDTFRLAEKRIDLRAREGGETFNCILPHRIAQEIARIFSSYDKQITCVIGENQFEIRTENTVLLSRLIDGNFPAYNAIIPNDFETSSFVNRQELIQSIRTSSIFSSKLQDVTLQFEGKELEIASGNADIGEYKTVLSSQMSGKDARVSFNHKYLLDGVQICNEEELFFGVNTEQKPSMLRNKSDGTFLYVVMPIRLT